MAVSLKYGSFKYDLTLWVKTGSQNNCIVHGGHKVTEQQLSDRTERLSLTYRLYQAWLAIPYHLNMPQAKNFTSRKTRVSEGGETVKGKKKITGPPPKP